MLGWTRTVTMPELCRMMVDADLHLAERERTSVAAGHPVDMPWSEIGPGPSKPIAPVVQRV